MSAPKVRTRPVTNWATPHRTIRRGVMVRGNDGQFCVIDAAQLDRLIEQLNAMKKETA